MRFFCITHKSRRSQARLGKITTSHGEILTPAFVPVATKGTLKAIPPKDIREIGIQVAFVNIFHLVDHPGIDVIEKFGGIHTYANLSIPLMSDSGGFQVFSLAEKRASTREGEGIPLVKVTEKGVRFRSPRTGRELLFSPELSIRYQEKIGADIIMAFDECIYYGASHQYTTEATERTHRWLLRCIQTKGSSSTLPPQARDRSGLQQFLYGIVQGGVFKDLRIASAKFVAQQNTPGIAIGGVSVGETKKEMREQVKWVTPFLPEEKPKHLLGIGRIEDILDFVPLGIDTFDCVEPTRLARNGVVFQNKGKQFYRIDLTKAKYLKDKNPIQKDCQCYTCEIFSLSFLHHLFKERELLGYYLATYHNLYFLEQIFKKLRIQIQKGEI
ncbi:MAG: tRNA guanosine(34) transglycosylase Tgt [Candidatus Wildermuthbacteria bacterium]|nr:tRNA guanosine(34) transglycosylase Tgt [Candidatus Wildermuthbacteria bacterium]